MIAPRRVTIPWENVAAAARDAGASLVAYPLPHQNANHMVQPFGVDWIGDGFYRSLSLIAHSGWDLRAKIGTRAYAVFSGEVTQAFADRTGGIQLDIAGPWFSVPGFDRRLRLRAVYYHLRRFMVFTGHQVDAGQFIAETGNTGRYTTGPHLHFALKLDVELPNGAGTGTLDPDNGYNGCVDPALFMPNDDWRELPVDRRYGKARDLGAEISFFTIETVKRWFRMRSSEYEFLGQREVNAVVYGRWPLDVVLSPVRFYDWTERVST